MNYKNYIDIGFERSDFQFNEETGHMDYTLTYHVNPFLKVLAFPNSLNKPELMIIRPNNTGWHIIPISVDIMKDLIQQCNDRNPTNDRGANHLNTKED